MDVNPIKEKQLTNHRAAGSDDLVRLVPARVMSLEQALEFITDDECVEVTPHNVRLRKVVLSASDRGRIRGSGRPPAKSDPGRRVERMISRNRYRGRST